MNTYPIPDTLEAKYKGAGYALAASVNGELTDIKYLSDLIPEFNPVVEQDVAIALDDPRVAFATRELSILVYGTMKRSKKLNGLDSLCSNLWTGLPFLDSAST